MPLGMEVDFSPGDFVLDGDLATPKMGKAPQFLAHVYCDQMAGWMKMPLGVEVDSGSAHIVLDGDPAPPAKGNSTIIGFIAAPSFWRMSIVATVAHLSYC